MARRTSSCMRASSSSVGARASWPRTCCRTEVAAWKPYPDRHSIWELTLHVAYRDYAVHRRITGGPKGAFPRSPSDWPDPPAERSGGTWDRDRRLLREWHERLVDVLRDLSPSRLDEVPRGEGRTTHADLVTGALLHETYHTGQIQLMKRLARSEGV